MSPRLPRDVSGADLARLLETYGYAVTRQKGSHLRLTTHELCHVDRKALPRELVHDRQHPDHPTIRRPVHHEVVTPAVLPVRRPQPDA